MTTLNVILEIPRIDTVYLPSTQNSYYRLVHNDAMNLKNEAHKKDLELAKSGKPFTKTERSLEYYIDAVYKAYRQSGELDYRPIDKRDNHIKRCVGLPGDSLYISNGILYINGKRAFVAPDQQKSYTITFKENVSISAAQNVLLDMDLNSMDFEESAMVGKNAVLVANMSIEKCQHFKEKSKCSTDRIKSLRSYTSLTRFFRAHLECCRRPRAQFRWMGELRTIQFPSPLPTR